MNMAKFIQNQS
ncbi:TPA: hypothetical protein HMU40_25560, partial [Escherichia coli]|nr:hypothetical protein [Escherichia coli]